MKEQTSSSNFQSLFSILTKPVAPRTNSVNAPRLGSINFRIAVSNPSKDFYRGKSFQKPKMMAATIEKSESKTESFLNVQTLNSKARKFEGQVFLSMAKGRIGRINPKVNSSILTPKSLSNKQAKTIAVDISYMDKAVTQPNTQFINFVKTMELPQEQGRSACGRFVSLEGAKEPIPYWNDPRVHNFGNNSWFSAIAAPIATKIIDVRAYDGVDLRKQILKDIPLSESVCDLCCGVGTSTVAWGTGVDTSNAFLTMARLQSIGNSSRFVEGNAETFGDTNSFDVVTCFFATHEMPRLARRKVLANAKRIARKRVIFVDIDPSYEPSEAMLSGEPYFKEYRRNIDLDFRGSKKEIMVQNHVAKWEFQIREMIYGHK